MAYKAIVIGALGVIGRYIVERLEKDPNWEVIGISRRKGTNRQRVQYLALDVLDRRQCDQVIGSLEGITHVFYAAFQASQGPASSYASNIDVNRDMLVNSVSAVATHHVSLERVVLVTGTKYYGVHLGPIKTPARESDPRHIPPNYYFDQIDWLKDFQSKALQDDSLAARAWDWVELRPQTLCGFAPGTAMSIIPVIAVYAALCKDLGLPLRGERRPGPGNSPRPDRQVRGIPLAAIRLIEAPRPMPASVSAAPIWAASRWRRSWSTTRSPGETSRPTPSPRPCRRSAPGARALGAMQALGRIVVAGALGGLDQMVCRVPIGHQMCPLGFAAL